MVASEKESAPKSSKRSARSVVGMLFNPQLGASVRPLGESTRIFLHLLASVFSVYGLIPKDYPGLRDEKAPMSLGNIMGTAWNGLNFSSDGLPKIGLFFGILGLMLFGIFGAFSAVLSLFIGHAHAQGEFISPNPGTDIAQQWINYLFLGQGMGAAIFNQGPAYVGQTGAIIPTNQALQNAFINALGFYSEAMLIIAAMILFYHLTAMVMETAHHGQVMGKRANQMWAPIRLVMAIGMLVPIAALGANSGLNSGQFIVIKMAELGSALATNAWTIFLDSLAAYNPGNVPPMAPVVSQIAADLMSSEACAYDYNMRVQAAIGGAPAGQNGQPAFGGFQGANGANDLLIHGSGGTQQVLEPVQQCTTTINGHTGIKYSFTPGPATARANACSTGDLADQDICGWYFIPNITGGAGTVDQASTTAYNLETAAFQQHMPALTAAATTGNQGIIWLMPQSVGGRAYTQAITVDPSSIDAVIEYQMQVGANMNTLATSLQGAMQQAVATLTPYGWVLAGALLPMVARMQAMIGNAATAGMPETHPPQIYDPTKHNSQSINGIPILGAAFNDVWSGKGGDNSNSNFMDPRAIVAEDMKNYTVLTSKIWAQTQSQTPQNAQCAAMIGLQDGSNDGGQGQNSIVNAVFSIMDRVAQLSGVWSEGTGQPCSAGSPTAGITTFTIGIQQFNGGDPLSEMAALGHANLNTGFNLLGLSMAASLGGNAAKALGNIASMVPTMGTVGGLLGGLGGMASTVLSFVSLIFMLCGFTLAYILPLFPFTRFFFSVLVWVAALLEAVVAVPLIALAHLNPEGEGLPGNSARAAYFYVFNLMLRPILMIFGLVCGLLLFLIAISFLTYAYNLAVAASGATAYGHEMMSKFVYTVMYVAIAYVSANHSFQLIDHIPEKALSWMGAQAQSMANVGNAGHLAKVEGEVAGIVQQQFGQQLGGATNHIGGALQQAFPGRAAAGTLPGRGAGPTSPGNGTAAPKAGGGTAKLGG